MVSVCLWGVAQQEAQAGSPLEVVDVNEPVYGTRLGIGAQLVFEVKFNDLVMVEGNPALSVKIGNVTRKAQYVSGSGSDALNFRYVIQEGDLEPVGIRIDGFDLSAGALNSSQSVSLSNPILTNVTVDGIAPKVVSIEPVTLSSYGSTPIRFIVTFNKSLSVNIPPQSFTLNTTGTVTSDGVTNVGTRDWTVFEVEVWRYSGYGTVRLDLKDGSGNRDTAGNLVAGFTGGTPHTLVPRAQPTIAISASKSDPAPGEIVTFTAELSNGNTPTGIVTFKDGTQVLGHAAVSGLTAWLPTDQLSAGPHSITAEYSGDEKHLAATSAPITVNISQKVPTIALSASKTLVAYGDEVVFTARITSDRNPTGTVTFLSGSAVLGTATIASGESSFFTSALAVGPHSITATYNGDRAHTSVSSAAQIITVGKAEPTLSLSASSTNLTAGGDVTLTATLTGGILPTGEVVFTAPGISESRPIAGGSASLDLTNLGAGTRDWTAQYAGDANNGIVTSSIYRMTVGHVLLTLTPAGGPLPAAVIGEAYQQSITATNGTSPYTFHIESGALPAGLLLLTTGEIAGTAAAALAGSTFGVTIKATDARGATGTQRYSLKVEDNIYADNHRPPSGYGAPGNVDLTRNARGGPFTSADILSVTPSHAGTASIVRGEFAQAGGMPSLGWYLKFVPRPDYSGPVIVGYTLTNASGATAAGTTTYAMLGYDPGEEKTKINNMARSFVENRQSKVASSIKVPGLMERRQANHSNEAVTTTVSPSQDGMSATFSTSYAQIQSARDAGDGVSGAYLSPFNLWIDGSLLAHNRDENGEKWGSFGMVNLGADYLLSEKALLGFSLHYDVMSDPTKDDAELKGNGWMAGPYASFELGSGVFWDASLLYGGSSNDIDTAYWDGSFTTSRWMADSAIKGRWQLDDVTFLTPKLRALYFKETIDDYTMRNSLGDELSIKGFDTEQFRVSLGAEISRSFAMDNGANLKPTLGLTGGYAGMNGSGLYGSLTAGLMMQTSDLWMLDASMLYNIEGDGRRSIGARLRAGRNF